MALLSIFSKTFEHKCSDGTTHLVYKNIDNALPLAVKEANKKFDSELKGFEKVSAKLKSEYASKIKGLLYSINEENQSLILNFRISYIAFQSNPCDDPGFLKRQAILLIEGQQRITELKAQISGLISLASAMPNDKEGIFKLYIQIVRSFSKITPPDETVYEIRQNRNAANQWINGGENE